MSLGSTRRCFALAAALLVIGSFATASAAPLITETKSGDLGLTVLLKDYPGGR